MTITLISFSFPDFSSYCVNSKVCLKACENVTNDNISPVFLMRN